MAILPKKVLRNIITYGNSKTKGNLHSYIKDMFKDILQEILETDELEMELEYSGDKK